MMHLSGYYVLVIVLPQLRLKSWLKPKAEPNNSRSQAESNGPAQQAIISSAFSFKANRLSGALQGEDSKGIETRQVGLYEFKRGKDSEFNNSRAETFESACEAALKAAEAAKRTQTKLDLKLAVNENEY